MDIGWWVKRDRPHAKWHLVESVVAGDAITHCGRRLRDQPVRGAGLAASASMPLTRMIDQPQLCKRCA